MFDYFILGILQGIFEWLPVSSEGIVALASQCLSMKFHPVDIALFLHLGTLLSVLIYFKNDWKEVLLLKNMPLLRFLVIATIVSLMLGYPIYRATRSLVMGNALLFIMGLGLLLTSCFQKSGKKIKVKQDYLAVIAGFLQGLAVIPGLSRSGSTIFGLSLSKESPPEILKISYMMSAPVILASNAYLLLENPDLLLDAWPALIFSFLAGLLSLRFLMKFSEKINFSKFTLIFGLLCLLGAALNLLV